MNKSQLLLLLFVLVGRVGFAQGIDFQHITFEEALVKAQEQNKLIFIDFYTAWCGPCKKLAKGPFMEPEVGEYYNQHFINLKLDAEQEGKQAAELFAVNRYPTLLFVNGDSKLVYRGTGSTMNESGGMIPFAQLALAATNDQITLEDMQRLFPDKQTDEAFLKSYYNKLVEYEMNPSEAIDAWLKVQTEMDESGEEMLEFILKHSTGICLGSNIEAILRTNYDHYLTIASKQNKIRLERIEGSIINATLKRAYSTHNAELMRRYIDHCKEKNLGPAKRGQLSFYELEYLRLANDNVAYKKAVVAYVDSIINQKAIKQIKQEDAEACRKYMEFSKDKTGIYVEHKRQMMRQGEIATENVEDIVEVSRYYWLRCETKADYRHLKRWINYCYKLIPNYWSVNNLEADLLYEQGKHEKAIALKQSAIDNVPFTYKKKPNLQYQLQLMKEGQKVFDKSTDETETEEIVD